jgi:cysteine sulfinate desulfinase/cysteine desulfurase-like protein
VRFSLGLFNHETEIATALDALRELLISKKGDRR